MVQRIKKYYYHIVDGEKTDAYLVEIRDEDERGVVDLSTNSQVILPTVVIPEDVGTYSIDLSDLPKYKEYKFKWKVFTEQNDFFYVPERFTLDYDGFTRKEIRSQVRQLIGEMDISQDEVIDTDITVHKYRFSDDRLNQLIQYAVDIVLSSYQYTYHSEEEDNEIKNFIDQFQKKYIFHYDEDILPIPDICIIPIIKYASYLAISDISLQEASSIYSSYEESLRKARIFIEEKIKYRRIK